VHHGNLSNLAAVSPPTLSENPGQRPHDTDGDPGTATISPTKPRVPSCPVLFPTHPRDQPDP